MSAPRLEKGKTIIIVGKDGVPRYRKIESIELTVEGCELKLKELGHSERRWAKVKPPLRLNLERIL